MKVNDDALLGNSHSETDTSWQKMDTLRFDKHIIYYECTFD